MFDVYTISAYVIWWIIKYIDNPAKSGSLLSSRFEKRLDFNSSDFEVVVEEVESCLLAKCTEVILELWFHLSDCDLLSQGIVAFVDARGAQMWSWLLRIFFLFYLWK
jgi:hypothetical protein